MNKKGDVEARCHGKTQILAVMGQTVPYRLVCLNT